MSAPWPQLLALAQAEVNATIRALPKKLQRQAQPLPVLYETHPNRMLQADGIEADTLGLFVGEPFAEGVLGAGPLPAQIILFLDNLWDEAGGNESIYRQEVRATYLHEVGHYLGLDEDDLDERGLG